jgi:hypothetical protein
MSKCIDETVGSLLHAWELDILTDEDKRKFEQHLIACSSCFEVAQKHRHAMEELRSNPAIQAQVSQYAGLGERGKPKREPWYAPITRNPVWRYALAAVLLLALAAPLVYRQLSEETDLEVAQVIRLVPTRSTQNSIVYLDWGQGVEMQIMVPEITQPGSYVISVGPVGLEEATWRDQVQFDSNGRANFVLPLSNLQPGPYELKVLDPKVPASTALRIYYFGVRATAS